MSVGGRLFVIGADQQEKFAGLVAPDLLYTGKSETCNLELETCNLEPGTWDLGPGTWDLEPET